MTPEREETPAQQLLQLARGLQVSQALYAAVKLGIADHLENCRASSAQLAELTHAHAPSLYRLLRLLAAWDIVAETEPDSFLLRPLGRPLLSDSPDSIRDAVLLFASDHFVRSWSGLTDSVCSGVTAFSQIFGSSNPFAYYAEHPELEPIANAGMANLARLSARAIVEALLLESMNTVVDVGGGRGVLLSMMLQASQHLQGVLFDLPHVVPAAEAVLCAAGVSERCRIVGGDMFQTMPAGADGYVFSRVIHDWDDERAIALLKVCRRVMPPGARLFLVERVLPEISTASLSNQTKFLSDLNMLVRTGGRERTHKEFDALFSAAGLQLSAITPANNDYSIVEGRALA